MNLPASFSILSISSDEDGFIILGISSKFRLFVDCPCYQEAESLIQNISARKASKRRRKSMSDIEMINEYNFEKSIENPYIKHLKQPITIRIEPDTINYFKELAQESEDTISNFDQYVSDTMRKGT